MIKIRGSRPLSTAERQALRRPLGKAPRWYKVSSNVCFCNSATLIDVRSTSGLSRSVLPRRLWRVVCWVGFLSNVISGVESALWEGCYPALTLVHGVCVIVYV